MPVPRIAIVGRPNVGKSSLLNMIAGDKVSIVDPTAGTTRDRVSILTTLPRPGAAKDDPGGVRVEFTDTGGYGVYVVEGRRYNDVGADLASLTKDIERQISLAVEGADLVLFVIDAQAGVTPQDEQIARMLRQRVLGSKARTDLRVQVVANKCDGPRWEAHAAEAANLGFGEPLPVSAKNNYFRRDLMDGLHGLVMDLPGVRESLAEGGVKGGGWEGGVRIAIIGKRNSGKSSLVNALAGEDRVIVSEIAGTTRDAVDVRFEIKGRTFTAIDTAGLRKKKSFADRIEWWAFDRAKAAIDRADVVILLLDATEPLSQVDEQLAMLAQKAHKPVVIAVNKWDMVEGKKVKSKTITPESYEEYLRKALKGLGFAPISFISAKKGLNLAPTIMVSLDLFEQAGLRVGTGKLNRVVREVLEARGPSSKLGTFAKVFYVAQVAVHPPTIAMVVNNAKLFTPNYQRFLLNRMREQLPFEEVPIRLIVRDRKRGGADPFVPFEQDVAATEREERAEKDRRLITSMPDDASSYFDDDLEVDVEGAEAEGSGDILEGAGAELDEDGDEAEVEAVAVPATAAAKAAGGGAGAKKTRAAAEASPIHEKPPRQRRKNKKKSRREKREG